MRDHELYERSIYERTVLSEPDVENYAISNELSFELSNISVKPIHEHRQVSRRDREPSRIPIRTVERQLFSLQILIEFEENFVP